MSLAGFEPTVPTVELRQTHALDCAANIHCITVCYLINAVVHNDALLQIGRSLVRSQLVSLEFFINIKSFRSHYGPGVDPASNRNEYQKYFLGVKAAGA